MLRHGHAPLLSKYWLPSASSKRLENSIQHAKPCQRKLWQTIKKADFTSRPGPSFRSPKNACFWGAIRSPEIDAQRSGAQRRCQATGTRILRQHVVTLKAFCRLATELRKTLGVPRGVFLCVSSMREVWASSDVKPLAESFCEAKVDQGIWIFHCWSSHLNSC